MSQKPIENNRPIKSALKQLIPIRIDGYIATEVLAPFLGGVIFFTFILLMFQVLRLASALIEHSVPFFILLKIVGFMIITFLPIVLPLAFLISVLVGFGRLSGDSELVAMKANGMSVVRLSLPVFFVSLAVSAASLGLNLSWVPQAKYDWRTTLIRLTNTTPIATIRESTFTTGFFGLLIYAENVDPKTERMRNVFLYDERDPKSPRTIVAPSGQIIPIKTDTELGSAIELKLYDGEIHSNDASAGTYSKTTFHEYRVYLRVDEGANNASGNVTNYSYKDLVFLKNTVVDPKKKNELTTEYYSRWLTSLVPILFVFIGIGFGTSRGRKPPLSAGLITILVIVPLYILQTVFTNFGHSGKLPPLLAMMIPDILLLLVGLASFRRSIW